MLDPRAFFINSKTGRVVATTFIEFLSGNSTTPSICFTDSPDSGLQCDNLGAVNYIKNGTNLGELGTASSLVGGSDTQIQFNNSGSFDGSSDLTWDDTAKELGVGGDINLDDGGTYATTLQLITPTANRTISLPDATGTVGLVGGSSGQLIYNNAGAYAGAPSTSVGASGDITLSLAGAASTPPVSLTGTWFSGGTSTTTKPQLLIEPVGTTSTAWSTDGTGLGVNAASGFAGNLLDFQVNGSSKAVLTGAGLLGVGTTSPGQLLSLRSSSPLLSFDDSDGTYGVHTIGPDSSGRLLEFHCDSGSVAFGGGFIFKDSSAERARIDDAGRLLVGTSSSTADSNRIQSRDDASGYTFGAYRSANSSNSARYILYKSRGSAGSPTVVQANDLCGQIEYKGYDGTNYISAAAINVAVDGTPGANDMPGRLVFSVTADGASSPTEALRINNRRISIFFGDTGHTVKSVIQSTTNRGIVSGEYVFQGGHSGSAGSVGTVTFQVATNGNVENTNNSYGAISDIKLKENIVDANSQWSDIKSLQVRNYNFKEGQTHTQLGLIAQEVELVSPGLVSETPDHDAEGNDLGTVTKSVNYSVLYMKAVKALQEAMERIETLETEMAAVKAQLS